MFQLLTIRFQQFPAGPGLDASQHDIQLIYGYALSPEVQ